MQKNLKNVFSVSFDWAVLANYSVFSVPAMLILIGFVGAAFDIAWSIVLVSMIQASKKECQNLVKAISF